MSEAAELLQRPRSTTADDSAKRRQIVDGRAQGLPGRGFDAASMMDIAKAAGVSKGTLYVYFKDKDELFAAIVSGECVVQDEGVFDFDHADHDVEAVLLQARQGVRARGLGDPDRMSSWRTVIAIAERMPDLGRKIYESRPGRRRRQARRLSQGADRGRHPRHRRLRDRGGAVHRDLPRHHVETDAVQLRPAADARTHRPRRRYRRAHVPRGLSRQITGPLNWPTAANTPLSIATARGLI